MAGNGGLLKIFGEKKIVIFLKKVKQMRKIYAQSFFLTDVLGIKSDRGNPGKSFLIKIMQSCINKLHHTTPTSSSNECGERGIFVKFAVFSCELL